MEGGGDGGVIEYVTRPPSAPACLLAGASSRSSTRGPSLMRRECEARIETDGQERFARKEEGKKKSAASILGGICKKPAASLKERSWSRGWPRMGIIANFRCSSMDIYREYFLFLVRRVY